MLSQKRNFTNYERLDPPKRVRRQLRNEYSPKQNLKLFQIRPQTINRSAKQIPDQFLTFAQQTHKGQAIHIKTLYPMITKVITSLIR